MLLSKEVDYGIRIFRVLSQGGKYSINEIAEMECMPKAFMYKISKKLENEGYIKIYKGAHGGCQLNVDLKEVKLTDLIQLLEGRQEIISCMDPNYDCPYRNKHMGCNVHCNLLTLQGRVDALVSEYSVADIL